MLKEKDIEEALTESDRKELDNICGMIAATREARDAGELSCVVVEKDWPEYEQVWSMIESRLWQEQPSMVSRSNLIHTMRKLTDEKACQYNGNGYCQTHLHDDPCPHDVSKAYLGIIANEMKLKNSERKK